MTGLPRSTVARTLRTLADTGLVDETGERTWLLGHELIRLARTADPSRKLVDAAHPTLQRLRDAAGESALLAVPRGLPGMEILLQVDPERHVGVANWVGADVPLHASSAGKLVLAELGEGELGAWLDASPLPRFTDKTITDAGALRAELELVRRQGWAEFVDELEVGLASMSAPVRMRGGLLLGIVGVSGPTFRLTRARRRELLPLVLGAAAAVEGAYEGATASREIPSARARRAARGSATTARRRP